MDSEKNHLNLLEENFVNKFLETVEEFKKPNNKRPAWSRPRHNN